MSNENDKAKGSKRRQKDENAVKKQLKIIKNHNSYGDASKSIDEKQPHRLAKKHAMDCGNPKCFICGNPRKTHKDKLTTQEKRMMQDIDAITDKRTNGLRPKEDADE